MRYKNVFQSWKLNIYFNLDFFAEKLFFPILEDVKNCFLLLTTTFPTSPFSFIPTFRGVPFLQLITGITFPPVVKLLALISHILATQIIASCLWRVIMNVILTDWTCCPVWCILDFIVHISYMLSSVRFISFVVHFLACVQFALFWHVNILGCVIFLSVMQGWLSLKRSKI